VLVGEDVGGPARVDHELVALAREVVHGHGHRGVVDVDDQVHALAVEAGGDSHGFRALRGGVHGLAHATQGAGDGDVYDFSHGQLLTACLRQAREAVNGAVSQPLSVVTRRRRR